MGKLDRFNKAPSAAKNKAAGQSKLSAAEIAAQTMSDEDGYSLETLPLESIKPNEMNCFRENDTDLSIEQLAADIERNGLLHNLVVSDRGKGDYYLISGERRFRALSLLERKAKKTLEKANAGTDAAAVRAATADVRKWAQVQCRIATQLTKRQERIRLYAANLQDRGVVGGGAFFREAMAHYTNDLKDEFSITQAEADALLKQIVSADERTIERQLRVERTLCRSLKAMLDGGQIKQHDAEMLCNLSPDEQIEMADTVERIKRDTPEQAAEAEAILQDYVKAARAETDSAREKQLAAAKQRAEETVRAQRATVKKEYTPIAEKRAKDRMKYIAGIDRLETAIRAMMDESKLKNIRSLEKKAQEGEPSIRAKLEELSAVIDRLKAEIDE